MNSFAVILLLVGSFTGTFASPGNDLFVFDECIYQCTQITCLKNPYHLIQQEFADELQENDRYQWRYYNPIWNFDSMPLPFYLRALFWTCEQNCDYQCQRLITKERIELAIEDPVLQYHGKWPFLRVLGIQEFASALFSLGNFYVNYLGFKKLKNSYINSNYKSTYFDVFLVSIVSMLAWLFSTIFHVRDFLITEKLDYYFAGATVLSGFHGIASRLFELYKKPILKLAFFFTCLAAFAAHVYRLEIDWLYTYNMRANIVVGILQNICLCKLCFNLYCKYYYEEQQNQKTQNLNHLTYIDSSRMLLSSFYGRSPKLYSLYALLLALIVTAGITLEIKDFPPIYDLIDAHSLWHLVTIIPLYYGWYDWMIWDIKENIEPDLESLKIKKDQ
jgi:hypothetical protein